MRHTHIGKADIAHYGKRYAEILLYNSHATIRDLHEINEHFILEDMSYEKRKKFERDIKDIAKNILIAAGYDVKLCRKLSNTDFISQK